MPSASPRFIIIRLSLALNPAITSALTNLAPPRPGKRARIAESDLNFVMFGGKLGRHIGQMIFELFFFGFKLADSGDAAHHPDRPAAGTVGATAAKEEYCGQAKE